MSGDAQVDILFYRQKIITSVMIKGHPNLVRTGAGSTEYNQLKIPGKYFSEFGVLNFWAQ